MPRIRTIKPEFPQSESMGRVSREARLLFILLWTICDDAGRTRAASRMLASLLYPYDDDAAKRIDGWLKELERENCVVRYKVDGSTYLQICNWLNHQKIDKPSGSKIPPFANIREDSPNPREDSSGDLDLDLDLDLDQGPKDQGPQRGAPKARPARTCPDDFVVTDELRSWAAENCPGIDIDRETAAFKDYTFATAKTDWVKTWRNWMRKAKPANKPRPTRYEELMGRVNSRTEPPTPPNLLLVGGKL
jgi:hypothetical protein